MTNGGRTTGTNPSLLAGSKGDWPSGRSGADPLAARDMFWSLTEDVLQQDRKRRAAAAATAPAAAEIEAMARSLVDAIALERWRRGEHRWCGCGGDTGWIQISEAGGWFGAMKRGKLWGSFCLPPLFPRERKKSRMPCWRRCSIVGVF